MLLLLPHLLNTPEAEHWRLPVAYAAVADRMYTLREIVASRPTIRPPTELDALRWKQLALARLRKQTAYQYAGSAGTIRTPDEAVGAIESGSALGARVLEGVRELVTRLVNEGYEVAGREPPVPPGDAA